MYGCRRVCQEVIGRVPLLAFAVVGSSTKRKILSILEYEDAQSPGFFVYTLTTHSIYAKFQGQHCYFEARMGVDGISWDYTCPLALKTCVMTQVQYKTGRLISEAYVPSAELPIDRHCRRA